MVFDARDGLYRGEHVVPRLARADLSGVDRSRHGPYRDVKSAVDERRARGGFEIAAELADERGDRELSARWRGWASDLRAAIRRTFWLPERKMFAAFTPTFLDPAPSARFDLLGTALVVLLGVADTRTSARRDRGVSALPKGPPVVWPPTQRRADLSQPRTVAVRDRVRAARRASAYATTASRRTP